ncbi:MAG: hypothetical protein ACLFMO_03945 [Eubacteriales bacterium]
MNKYVIKVIGYICTFIIIGFLNIIIYGHIYNNDYVNKKNQAIQVQQFLKKDNFLTDNIINNYIMSNKNLFEEAMPWFINIDNINFIQDRGKVYIIVKILNIKYPVVFSYNYSIDNNIIFLDIYDIEYGELKFSQLIKKVINIKESTIKINMELSDDIQLKKIYINDKPYIKIEYEDNNDFNNLMDKFKKWLFQKQGGFK